MNDIEKAIDYFYEKMESGKIENDYQQEIYEISISALEKQIPNKPYYLQYPGNVGNWNHGIACICDYKARYCRHCGQKLDWSEVEE